MTHGDAEHGAADDLIVCDCEEVRRLYVACREGIARLGALDVSDPTTAKDAAATYWQSRLCLEYEGKALRLQERPAFGNRGLIAKCEQLEAFLDYKVASMDGDLHRAIMLLLADIRRMAGMSRLAREQERAGRYSTGQLAWQQKRYLRSVDCSPSLPVSDTIVSD